MELSNSLQRVGDLLFLQCIPSADLFKSPVEDEGRAEDHDRHLHDVHVNDGSEASP